MVFNLGMVVSLTTIPKRFDLCLQLPLNFTSAMSLLYELPKQPFLSISL